MSRGSRFLTRWRACGAVFPRSLQVNHKRFGKGRQGNGQPKLKPDKKRKKRYTILFDDYAEPLGGGGDRAPRGYGRGDHSASALAPHDSVYAANVWDESDL